MKQYLMMCTDEIKTQMESVFRGVEFLEIQGMNLNGENKLCVLVTPVIQPVPTAHIKTEDKPLESCTEKPIESVCTSAVTTPEVCDAI